MSPWNFEARHQATAADRRAAELTQRYQWALDATSNAVARNAGRLEIGLDFCALIVTIGQRREYRLSLLDESVTPPADKNDDPDRMAKLEAALGRLVLAVFRGEAAA